MAPIRHTIPVVSAAHKSIENLSLVSEPHAEACSGHGAPLNHVLSIGDGVMKILLLAGVTTLVLTLSAHGVLPEPVHKDELRWTEGLVLESPR
jgi:hypothetical protein